MRGENGAVVVYLFALICVIGYVAGSNLYLLAGSSNEYNVTIDKVWIKSQGDNGQKYLFSDTEGNVYSVEDSYWNWIFDASDRFATIKQNKTYHINTFGRRSHWFSNYPNAIKIAPIN
ncbi:MAG: hypothetical protein PHU71_07155 [Candidatus Gracilibacteria bacterium]|nr:hypothetical protein [Candidatus Gracilibacteria bacterium]